MKNKYSERYLEEKMVKYTDLIKIRTRENKEIFTSLSSVNIGNGYIKLFNDMEKLLGPTIHVRKNVAKMLTKAQGKLQKMFPNLSLYVTYGYRSLEIQTERFLKELSKQKYFTNPVELYEETHRYVAVPSVAGHPTGGAIDIIIKDLKTNKIIDFGAKQYDYSNKRIYVFSPDVSKKARENRMLLRNILMTVGFAPFDGEWWHFSYGDREWAYYYKKNQAIYGQIKYEDLDKFML